VSVIRMAEMSDKNLEQRIKFCVKIGRSASEMLALLTVLDLFITVNTINNWL
jgi:hypothetical protein